MLKKTEGKAPNPQRNRPNPQRNQANPQRSRPNPQRNRTKPRRTRPHHSLMSSRRISRPLPRGRRAHRQGRRKEQVCVTREVILCWVISVLGVGVQRGQGRAVTGHRRAQRRLLSKRSRHRTKSSLVVGVACVGVAYT